MHLNPPANVLEEGNGQFAAEMFAKFIEAMQKGPFSLRIRLPHERMVEGKIEFFEKRKNAIKRPPGEHSRPATVEGIEGQSQGNSFTMRNGEAGYLLQFMGGPVPEIERPRGAEFKRIAALRDMLEMKLSTAVNGLFHDRNISPSECEDVFLQLLEKHGVADEGNLDGFNQPGASFRWRKTGPEITIVEDGEGRCKGADEVLFTEGINAVFDADSAIGLAEGGGGETNVADTAMGRCRGKSNGIEQSSATNREKIGMAAKAGSVDLAMKFLDEVRRILGLFTSGHNQWRTNEPDGKGLRREAGHDLIDQVRESMSNTVIDDDEGLITITRFFKQPSQNRIFRREDGTGKKNAMVEPDREGGFQGSRREFHSH